MKGGIHMTTITIRQNGDRFRLTAVGHATGGPEVCAAVSALVYALAGSLKNLERSGAATLGAFRLESGAADLEARGEAARDLFAMAAVGLMQIEAGYPGRVRVESNLGAARSCARKTHPPTGVQQKGDTP